MKNKSNFKCANCKSLEVYVVNSYKHHCLICRDCSNVNHVKKNTKLLFEYFLPRKLAKSVLPTKAFMRLFSDKGDFEYEKFYDAFVEETNNVIEDVHLGESGHRVQFELFYEYINYYRTTNSNEGRLPNA